MIVWRHVFVLVMFGLAASALAARVVYLGVTERDFLQGQGDARSVRSEALPAMRGAIVDRNGEALAVSTPVYAVWTDPSRANLDAETLARLAPLIDVTQDQLAYRLERSAGREFVYLKRRLEYADARALKAAQIPHVYLRREYRRYYPAAETAAHVVGLTNVDDVGIEGMELAYEAVLRGVAGGKVVLKDRLGNTIKDLEYESAPVYGRDVQLSLDMSLQFTAYRELKSAISAHSAKSGSVVVVDVDTGEILALVNQPSYNPNEPAGMQSGMRNRAATDAYEPGSTIKPFTALAALESGRFDRDTPIDTSPGYFHIGSKMIQDPVNRGMIDLEAGIAFSSQVLFAKLALALGEDSVFDVLTRAGLGAPPGSGLPGETGGFLDSGQLRYPVVRAALAYGYGLSVTPMQLAQAYQTLASHGKLRPLSIVRGQQPAKPRRVFDASLAAEVVEMMEGVTGDDGTASAAAVPGYRIAGKTGTARMVGREGYDDERHAAWFAGIAPVSDPKIVVVVLINEPGAGVSGGGAVAAPVFARVASRTLPLLGVLPDGEFAAGDLSGERGRG